MSRLVNDDTVSAHLHDATPLDQKARITHKGMAHFAGTGPPRKLCQSCAHMRAVIPQGKAKALKAGVNLTPYRGQCLKFKELTGRKGPVFPVRTPACRHYVEHKIVVTDDEEEAPPHSNSARRSPPRKR